MQFRITIPDGKGGTWDPSNDWSYEGVDKLDLKKPESLNKHITMYANGKLVWGEEPDGTKATPLADIGGAQQTVTTEPTSAETTTTTTVTTGGFKYSLELRNEPTKTTYAIGEELDLDGGYAEGWITGPDFNGDTFKQPLTYEGFTIDASAFDNTKPGTYKIYVKYGTATASFEVKVVSTPSSDTTPSSKNSESADSKFLYGDADCSGAVDVSDAVLVARFVNSDKGAKITEQGLTNADCDGVKGVSTDDITRILMLVARMISADDMGKKLDF